MLVLSRKENESILIGDNIRITVVGRSGSAIRIGVEAPHQVKVLRAELLEESPPAPRGRAGLIVPTTPETPLLPN